MFDVGFLELVVIAAIGLFVIGPERLPGAIRAVAMWVGRVKYFISETRSEFEKQIGADDIRRELHNEQVMRSLEALKQSKQELEESIKGSQNTIHPEKEPEDLPDFYPHDENGLAITKTDNNSSKPATQGSTSSVPEGHPEEATTDTEHGAETEKTGAATASHGDSQSIQASASENQDAQAPSNNKNHSSTSTK